MNIDGRRWAQKAQAMRFQQLETARRQAEGWRTGLVGLTGLLGAVLIVKGRDNVSDLVWPVRWLVVALLASAMAALVVATLTALRAAAGTPGRRALLSGEDLREWTRSEVAWVQRAITRMTALAVTAVTMIGVAVGLVWLGPTVAAQAGPLVSVQHATGTTCGRLLGIEDGTAIVATSKDNRRVDLVPLGGLRAMRQVTRCP